MANDEKPTEQVSDAGVTPEESKTDAGSAAGEENKSGPSDSGKKDGESDKTVGETVPKDTYDNAQKLIGKQGEELGQLRSFVEELTPLLDKLQAQPDVIQAIMDGKIDSELAKAVLEGKVGVEEAQVVTEAHDKVKDDMGKDKYEATSPEEISKMVEQQVEAKMSKERDSFRQGLGELENKQDFIKSVDQFVSSVPDFREHADDVTQWLDDHPDVYDISVAYEAVIGRKALMSAKESGAVEAAEKAKELAANAAGGTGAVTANVDEQELVDRLIGSATNPNKTGISAG